jgi:Na+/H+-dicarboxylate symporter
MFKFSSIVSGPSSPGERPLRYLSHYLLGLVQSHLWFRVLVGMLLGISVGILLGPTVGLVGPETASNVTNWLALPGQLFLVLIQMVVIPLIVASVVRGLGAAENTQQLRRAGVRVAFYFIMTTTVAITIGLTVATIIEPGRFIDQALVQQALGSSTHVIVANSKPPASPEFNDIPKHVLNLLPSNPLNSMVEGQMLQIVLFAIIMGVALVMMPAAQAKPLTDLMASLQQVSMTIVGWAMRLAPIAVFGLMTQLTAKIGLSSLTGMAIYVGTVILGLGILLCFYLSLVLVFAGVRPLKFLVSVRELLLLAFSTSSSAAVIPMSIRTAEDRFGVRPSMSQFIVPLGATVNMDGTALYQGVAAMFLAQVFGVDIGLGGMLLIVVTTVGASIGAPSAPGVGIVILSLVLTSVGIPPAGIALIIGVDRILDMSRTSINVCGDIVATTIINRWVDDGEEENNPGSLAGEPAIATARADRD